jgi:multidrug efflux pump subunit AcrA (membrane-fusion protein)
MGMFRDEVIRAKQLDWLGTVNIAVQPSEKLLGIAAILVLIALLAVVSTCHYQHRDDVRGVLEYSYPPAAVLSPTTGYITTVEARINSTVSEGQPLAYISSTNDVQNTIAIRSPQNGEVVDLSAWAGEHIKSGQLLFRIKSKETNLIAELPITPQEYAHINPGEVVNLRFPAYPYETYGTIDGTVEAIRTNDSKSRIIDPFILMVRVSQGSSPRSASTSNLHLRDGMAVETEIALDRRTLLGWIFDGAKKSVRTNTTP